MINNRSNKIKDMNVINNKLFNIFRDLNITCAEFAQAVKDVLNGEHYVWLESKYDTYDKFLPIAKINVETADIYVGIPVNKVLNIYIILILVVDIVCLMKLLNVILMILINIDLLLINQYLLQ